jgi:ubiquinone/menaquinone biosynthesis C-methylase UbiE
MSLKSVVDMAAVRRLWNAIIIPKPTAIDQNPKAIEYNRKTHGALGIDFHIGDAQALDFPGGNFDAVINVEASHCYPRQDAFFKSVYRVLRAGGHLLYADFRTPAHAPQLDSDIAEAGFQVKSKTDITAHVLAALKRTSERYRKLVHGFTPKILHPVMETFAAVEGSGVYNSFVNRERIYYSYCLVKAENWCLFSTKSAHPYDDLSLAS